jgi:plasmid stability protein
MGQILVRQLKDETIAALKQRAKANNRSTEAEVREIIEWALTNRTAEADTVSKRSILDFVAIGPGKRTTEEIVAEIRAIRDEWDGR